MPSGIGNHRVTSCMAERSVITVLALLCSVAGGITGLGVDATAITPGIGEPGDACYRDSRLYH